MPDIFKTVRDVASYLNESGYEVGESTVYRHKKEGKLIADGKGRYPVASVQRYADNWLTPRPGGVSADVIDLQEKKLTAEARKLEAQADHWELKTRIQSGEYVEREAFERELAARAMIFRSDMENFIRGHAGDIVDLVGGDAGRLPDLIDLYLDQLEVWLARYADHGATFGESEGKPEVDNTEIETDKEAN